MWQCCFSFWYSLIRQNAYWTLREVGELVPEGKVVLSCRSPQILSHCTLSCTQTTWGKQLSVTIAIPIVSSGKKLLWTETLSINNSLDSFHKPLNHCMFLLTESSRCYVCFKARPTFEKKTLNICLRHLIIQWVACLDHLTRSTSTHAPYCLQKIIHKYSLMERNNCVRVISYKELEIAMQRKSVVKAWNTERSKQKKWPPLQHPNDLNLPL